MDPALLIEPAANNVPLAIPVAVPGNSTELIGTVGFARITPNTWLMAIAAGSFAGNPAASGQNRTLVGHLRLTSGVVHHFLVLPCDTLDVVHRHRISSPISRIGHFYPSSS
jgi:hypothetical protein